MRLAVFSVNLMVEELGGINHEKLYLEKNFITSSGQANF